MYCLGGKMKNIDDKLLEIYNRDNFQCQLCGRPVQQIAHRIAKTKDNILNYGKDIIHHRHNLVSVCSLYCNGQYNIGFNPDKVNKLLRLINGRYNDIISANKIDKELQ
jgi:hypothetical protein